MNKNLKLGFIGGGALAEALIKSLVPSGLTAAQNIFVAERRAERGEELRSRYGVNTATTADDFLSKVEALCLAVKPKDAQTAMEEISNKISANTLLISVVAGLQLKNIEKNFGASQPIIRIMPNVAQAVGAGMAAFALGKNATTAHGELVQDLWGAVGRVVKLPENLLDAVTGLSGSGPAFGFLVIDALSDGGVAAGLPRDVATLLAAQTMYGAAKMVLDTEEHPDALRDKVTSPAGTTIAGVRVLEKAGVRSAMMEAVIAATEKSKELGR
ncbi:MAG: pyrroline-5-carboxylate reductase [Selenomonadaceae bacterium]|nr:pyrroline-5-carboxylate reductase [Selenomonadaceae bacterium]